MQCVRGITVCVWLVDLSYARLSMCSTSDPTSSRQLTACVACPCPTTCTGLVTLARLRHGLHAQDVIQRPFHANSIDNTSCMVAHRGHLSLDSSHTTSTPRKFPQLENFRGVDVVWLESSERPPPCVTITARIRNAYM